jgi:hypothetical protein
MLVFLAETPASAQRNERDSVWLDANGVFARRAAGRALLTLAAPDLPGGLGPLLDRFRASPGVRVDTDAAGRVIRIDAVGAPDGACAPALYINGTRWSNRRPDRPIWFVDVVPLFEIDAVELYAGIDAPVGDPGDCGALLVWSRARARSGDPPFAGRIEGVVRDTHGKPVAQITVTIEPTPDSATTDMQGRFVIDDLVPQEYRIVAGPAGAAILEPVEVRAFRTTSVELIIDAASSRQARSTVWRSR